MMKDKITPQNCWHYTKIAFRFWWRHILIIPPVFLLIVSLLYSNYDLACQFAFWTFLLIPFNQALFNPKARIPYESNFEWDTKPTIPQETWNYWDVGTPGSIAHLNSLREKI